MKLAPLALALVAAAPFLVPQLAQGEPTVLSTTHLVRVEEMQFRDVDSGSGSPLTITTIRVGDRVNWTWFAPQHSVLDVANLHGDVAGFQVPDPTVPSITENASKIATARAFDSGVRNTGAVFSVTFTAAGKHFYTCRVHPELMRGVVEVTE